MGSEPEASPQVSANKTSAPPSSDVADFREVTLTEVAEAIGAPFDLVWNRPRKGTRYEATLLPGGKIRLADGREFPSPSGAAIAAASVASYDGWYAWRIGGDTGHTLHDLRHQLADQGSPALTDALWERPCLFRLTGGACEPVSPEANSASRACDPGPLVRYRHSVAATRSGAGYPDTAGVAAIGFP